MQMELNSNSINSDTCPYILEGCPIHKAFDQSDCETWIEIFSFLTFDWRPSL